jgi:hypothetical protein
MATIKKMLSDEIYTHFKRKKDHVYEEEKHCKMLINIMMDPNRGTLGSFCVEAMINEKTFYCWIEKHELFRNLYYFSKMVAREVWEDEGRRIKDNEYQMGTINYEFEHWKMIGWTRFGVSKNARLKLAFNPTENPAKHYEAILKQAADGDFTAAEFKQLMEAVNVGLNVHQVFELQKQIDELKSDLSIMTANKDVENPFSDKRVKKKD